MNFPRALVIIVAMTLVAGFMGYALYLVNQANVLDKERMEACVANGGEWKRDFGNYYECVR